MHKEFLRISNKKDDTLVIDIDGIIGEDFWGEGKNTKQRIKQAVKEIAQSTASHIIVNINSYGGDVNHGVSIHDVLAEHKAKVTTRITGHTASAATIIAQAGDVREISDNALFLIHRAWTMAIGNISDMKAALSDLEKVDETIANIYAKRSGKSTEEINELMDRFDGKGEWLTANEAQGLGLVDSIFEPMKAAAMIQNSELIKFGLPAIPEAKIQTKTESAMKIQWNKAWTSIAALFNRAEDAPEEMDITEEMVDQMNNEITNRGTRITDLEAELTTANDALTQEREAHAQTRQTLEGERDQARNELQTTQAELARLNGKETKTKEKEDPSLDTSNLSPNEIAANKNAAALREG